MSPPIRYLLASRTPHHCRCVPNRRYLLADNSANHLHEFIGAHKRFAGEVVPRHLYEAVSIEFTCQGSNGASRLARRLAQNRQVGWLPVRYQNKATSSWASAAPALTNLTL